MFKKKTLIASALVLSGTTGSMMSLAAEQTYQDPLLTLQGSPEVF
ncbi:hypothetical protein [Erwinia sp.]